MGTEASGDGTGPCGGGPAARRWRGLLEDRAIPPQIREAATENPHRHDPARFIPPPVPPDTPSRSAALELLGPEGGTVLDVGCGAGAAGLALLPSAHHLTGLDAAADMIAAFERACRERGMPHDSLQASWPDAAEQVGTVDVTVCHHVGYNTADLVPFLDALTATARRGVVLELHAEHPTAWMDPLWRRFHGVVRSRAATAEDALEVLHEIGLAPRVQRWRKPPRTRGRDEVDLARRRLCLPADRAADVAEALDELPSTPRELVTVTWGT